MIPRRRLAALAIGIIAVTFLPGCWHYTERDTFGVAFSTVGPRAIVSIYRTPTLRLRQVYRGVLRGPHDEPIPCSEKAPRASTKCVRNALRAAGPASSYQFVKDRWAAATADGQLADLETAIIDSAGSGRCLTVDMKASLLGRDIGYNWTYRKSHQDACEPGGLDPVPGFRPSVG